MRMFTGPLTAKPSALQLTAWIACGLAVWMPAQSADACSCMQQEREAAFDQASSVFEGQVQSVDPVDEMRVRVRMTVVQTWKGADVEEIEVTTSSNSAACGYNFEVGQSYLVYADALDDGSQGVSLCSRTARVEDAAEDIHAMGQGTTPVDPEQGLGAGEPAPPQELPPQSGGCAGCAAAPDASGLPMVIPLAFVLFVLAMRRR
jgi:uncharacterized protein (TIGR03382 family)